MEKKIAKVNVGNPGGNASKGAVRYRLQLPIAWMKELGITAECKDIEMEFDGAKIIIKKA